MIVVFAGNRTDAPGRASRRFPAANAAWVGQRLERLLAALRPDRVVGAAAAGSDLLVLEAAAKLGIPADVVLPFAPDLFRESSVVDRGPGWTGRYDRLMDHLPPERLHVGTGSPEEEGVYLRGNAAILDAAARLAPGQTVIAVVVRPKRPETDASVTDDFVARAEARGILVLELDPGRRQADMGTAFIVMPYGVKTDREGNQIDCEAAFSKVVVPSLENADLDWTRADRQIEAGIIHVGMLDRLARSDAVVVDMATENANAFYELGARHVLRRGTTILIGPARARPIFNVNMLRRVGYTVTDSGITDTDAVDAVQRLRPFLLQAADGAAQPDSPLYQLFDVEPPMLRDRQGAALPAVELHRRLDLANGVGELEVIAAAVEEAGLPKLQRTELLLRAGVRLRENRAYLQSVRLLEGLEVSSASSLLYGWWCQQLALAERRLGEQLLQQGRDPDDYWDRAERRLARALQLLGDDPETCGIAGGLAKRRALRILRADRTATGRARAAAFLDRALGFYGRGFDRQPSDFYTGINCLTIGRIRTAQGCPPAGRDLGTVAAVTAFFTARGGGDEFWRAATAAELKLDEHLHAPERVTVDEVVGAYAAAFAVPHPADYAGPVRDQLDLVRLAGKDTGGVLDGVVDAVLTLPEFAPARGS